MKTIFRYVNTALLTVAFLAVGVAAGLGQDAPVPAAPDVCKETASADELRATFEKNYTGTVAQRKTAVEAAKQYVTKFGGCTDFKDFTEYLNKYLPGIEAKIAADVANDQKNARYTRFNNSVKATNFDETYASGKEILATEPDQLDVMISLGSIGYDESYKVTPNLKYNADTVKFAKQAIAAIEAGKTSKTFGLYQWTYKTKENALGWLNYTIGYITAVADKNKKDALPYLYKAVQANSETNKNPVPYELIGQYYFDELNKLTEEIRVLAATQNSTDTTEVAQQKVDTIKAKVALANGTSERAMDAFARAYTYSTAKLYKDKMYKNLQDAYKLRYAKTDGLDAWIAGAVKQQMPNPLTPVTPVGDPEPSSSASSGTKAPAATSVSPSAPAAVKPAPPVTTKPVGGSKPGAAKKPAMRKSRS